MMKMHKILAATITMLAVPAGASAAIITQFGTDVSFTYDDSTLFGTGTVVGNNIFFTPSNFTAESLNGAGVVNTTDTLNIDINAISTGFDLTSLVLVEAGDYKLDGAGASADASAYFSVISNTKNCGLLNLPCKETQIANTGALADTGGATALWGLSGSISFADTMGWMTDTSVNVTLQNNLNANTANPGETAFIQKKNGVIGVTVNPVPVPAAVWLFGSGLLGLVGIARRRNR